MMGYYDLVLGLIPVSFVGLTALFLLVGLSMTVAVPLGSLAAMGLVAHAMFVRAPVPEANPAVAPPSHGSAE